jgi:anti-sigma regulatory factor (Ser/Thr protein kinase)
MPDSIISRNANRVSVRGVFRIADLHRLLASIHQAVEGSAYEDLVLDFEECTAAFAGPMLGICAQVMKLREVGMSFSLVLPTAAGLARLFRNANWAHFLEPATYAPSTFKGYTQIPATQFRTPEDQNRAVNRVVNAILVAIPDIQRQDFAALEWSINEITDNVLTHAQSWIGGLVQVSTFQKDRKRIEYIVADAGIGIPVSLRETHSELTSDTEALDRAIREGVTRDRSVGQGNGLFGSYQICSHSRGTFYVHAGNARLSFTERGGLHVRNERVPYEGTLVGATIDFSVPHLLEEALRFGGQPQTLTDFVETEYERPGTEGVLVLLKNEATSFGSRPAGQPVRIKLANLARMCPGQKVYVDFTDIPLISSSFADEVFGKLFVEMGALGFMQRFEFRNLVQTVRQIIDRAIMQRSAAGIQDQA